MQELLGSRGQGQLLGTALVICPDLFHLLHRGFVLKACEHSGHVAVGRGHPQTLGGDGRGLGVDDDPVLHLAPQLQGLLLALLLLAADVGDHIVHHLRPGLEGLARAGNSLIGADQHLVQAEAAQGVQGGNIALEGAVGLNGNEPALHPQSLSLGLDDFDMLGIDLRHHHGHVGSPAVGRVVGDHGALVLGVVLLQSLDLFLLHIHGGEDKIHLGGNGLDVGLRIHDHHLLGLFGHGSLQGPAGANGLLIGLAGGAAAGRNDGKLEPGMILQQGNETLAHHAGAADDAYFVFFHDHTSVAKFLFQHRPVSDRKVGTNEKKENQQFTELLILYYNDRDSATLH